MAAKTQSLFAKLALSFSLGAALAALITWSMTFEPAPAPPPDQPAPKEKPTVPEFRYRAGLGELAPWPDWSRLDAYQGAVTGERLKEELNRVYRTGDAWRETFDMTAGVAAKFSTRANLTYTLKLAADDAPGSNAATTARYWRPAASRQPASKDQPLNGVRIVIDPGHIGGKWAKMEERWYQFRDGNPVMEGELTLTTALLLKPKLEALGAKVFLTRSTTDVVSSLRPEDFLDYARSRPGVIKTPRSLQKLSEKYFYRTWEIRERARLVNEDLKPDLTLCLHFNGDWGDANNPKLDNINHLHVLINGTYSASEYRLEDQRYDLFDRLLQGIHAEELALADVVATGMAKETGLPPFTYPGSNAQRVNDNPYVWARNLLANRVYKCPVVFLEPYMMSCREVYDRIQEGDYEGVRAVAGKKRKSIFREYADGVAAGLANYYRSARPSAAASP